MKIEGIKITFAKFSYTLTEKIGILLLRGLKHLTTMTNNRQKTHFCRNEQIFG